MGAGSDAEAVHLVTALAQRDEDLLDVLEAARLEGELQGGVAEARGERAGVVDLDDVGAVVRDEAQGAALALAPLAGGVADGFSLRSASPVVAIERR